MVPAILTWDVAVHVGRAGAYHQALPDKLVLYIFSITEAREYFQGNGKYAYSGMGGGLTGAVSRLVRETNMDTAGCCCRRAAEISKILE